LDLIDDANTLANQSLRLHIAWKYSSNVSFAAAHRLDFWRKSRLQRA
jgi:hypothetical protein